MKDTAAARLILIAGIASLLSAAGCGSDKPTATLTPPSFQNRGDLSVPVRPTGNTRPAARNAAATNDPAPLAKIPVGASLGEYQTIGGIVAEVNGNPIYANKVLKLVKAELAARALEMDADHFRAFATAEILKKIQGLERDELVFGAADRNLTGDERKTADWLTMQYRTQKITEAGGSVELAQRKAQADGNDFDEDVYDRYRGYMSEVFYRRKVLPRIQISADDLRAYYTTNLAAEFTEQDEVTFRLIKIASKRSNPAPSRKRAEEILAKAQSGDFAEIARTMNDDDRLARSGGEEVPVQRGAYRLEKVEKVLWETPAGKITPIIEDTGGFYIAKVESRKNGKTLAFEESDVQYRIRKTLWNRQFRTLTDGIEQALRKQSMVRDEKDDPKMLQIAVEMAMQNYAFWSTQRASAQ